MIRAIGKDKGNLCFLLGVLQVHKYSHKGLEIVRMHTKKMNFNFPCECEIVTSLQDYFNFIFLNHKCTEIKARPLRFLAAHCATLCMYILVVEPVGHCVLLF